MKNRTSWLLVLGMALLVTAHPLAAAPVTTQLETTDLTMALSEFTSVAFNATTRWQSNGTSNFKMRISNGTAGSPGHLVSGGSGITWATDAPQSFTLNFNGSVVTFTIVDGANTFTIETTPEQTEVNSIMIALRSQAGVGISSSIEVTNLAVNGGALSIPSALLGAVNSRTFLLVQGVGPGFTLTGNLRISKSGGAGEIPSMIVFAGMTPFTPSDEGGDEGTTSTPEPGTLALLLAGALLILVGHARRIWPNRSAVRVR
ncbi:MAG: PEP-CTERM sorting domain-containing protein [Bryobacterales bacterium]|nr:PEP-CTERM sorting domain-containing protein [Bryobacterales bacterium]